MVPSAVDVTPSTTVIERRLSGRERKRPDFYKPQGISLLKMFECFVIWNLGEHIYFNGLLVENGYWCYALFIKIIKFVDVSLIYYGFIMCVMDSY